MKLVVLKQISDEASANMGLKIGPLLVEYRLLEVQVFWYSLAKYIGPPSNCVHY